MHRSAVLGLSQRRRRVGDSSRRAAAGGAAFWAALPRRARHCAAVYAGACWCACMNAARASCPARARGTRRVPGGHPRSHAAAVPSCRRRALPAGARALQNAGARQSRRLGAWPRSFGRGPGAGVEAVGQPKHRHVLRQRQCSRMQCGAGTVPGQWVHACATRSVHCRAVGGRAARRGGGARACCTACPGGCRSRLVCRAAVRPSVQAAGQAARGTCGDVRGARAAALLRYIPGAHQHNRRRAGCPVRAGPHTRTPIAGTSGPSHTCATQDQHVCLHIPTHRPGIMCART